MTSGKVGLEAFCPRLLDHDPNSITSKQHVMLRIIASSPESGRNVTTKDQQRVYVQRGGFLVGRSEATSGPSIAPSPSVSKRRILSLAIVQVELLT
jgi:hypothetical protein